MSADAWAVADPCRVRGREACEDHLDEPPSSDMPSHRFRTADDNLREPDPLEVVEGVAVAGRISTRVSESGAGNTFLLCLLKQKDVAALRKALQEILG